MLNVVSARIRRVFPLTARRASLLRGASLDRKPGPTPDRPSIMENSHIFVSQLVELVRHAVTEIAFQPVAVNDNRCLRREHRSDLAEMLLETRGWQTERVGDMPGGIVFGFTRIEKKRSSRTPKFFCLIEREEFFGFDRLLRRSDIGNPVRRNLVHQKP